MEEIRHLRCGVVTLLCHDYGMIDDAVYFTTGEVLGRVPLRVGDAVNGLAVRDHAQGGLRALRVRHFDQGLTFTSIMNAARTRSIPEAEINSLLEDKGTWWSATRDTSGLGESRELVVLSLTTRNQDSETHRLNRGAVHPRYCDRPTGTKKWSPTAPCSNTDPIWEYSGPIRKAHPHSGPCLAPVQASRASRSTGPTALLNSVGKEMSEIDGDVVVENGEAHQDTVHKPAVQTEERDVEIVPGEKNLRRCAELLLHFPSFTIGRRLSVTVGSKEESVLQPLAPYCPAAPLPPPQAAQVVTVMASHPPHCHLPNFLGNYPVPQALWDCMMFWWPSHTLSAANVRFRFSFLLWLEELQAERELREFRITGALLRRGVVYLNLEVLGLAEGRPLHWYVFSPIIMAIAATCPYCSTIHVLELIHFIQCLVCSMKKPISGGVVMEYIGRCHLELDQTKHLGESDSRLPSKPIPIPGQVFNQQLNLSQREAVKHILARVYHRLPSSYVLVCTPSDSAADLICIQLHDSGFLHAASLARVNASFLAGDLRQLGPIVKSTLAQAFGLGVSLLKRLMANSLYTKENGDTTQWWPSWPCPLDCSTVGQQCVWAQRAVVDSLCHWSRLPTKGFPLIFNGVRGIEMREGNNSSWFKPGEVVPVMLYCCQLDKKLYNPVAANDISIITPYRKQSEKIHVLLHRVGLSNIKLGSVEEFQGQEFLVIILST
ncbi:unnamed protein product, partial [Coregonus sp. 'balchen']